MRGASDVGLFLAASPAAACSITNGLCRFREMAMEVGG